MDIKESSCPDICFFYFSLGNYKITPPVSASVHIAPDEYEFFFCLEGSFAITKNSGDFMNVSHNELLMISDDSILRSIQITTPLSGILIKMNKNSIYSLSENKSHIKKFMQIHEHCILFRNSLWIQSLFFTLNQLPENRKTDYCILKVKELIYLLSNDNHLFFDENVSHCKNNFLTNTVREMKKYMEAHLDEKLTIDYMSSRFHVSPTTFKLTFKYLYGKPVHSWLQEQRMQLAADYLHSTSMSVLQISQSVGYEGVSQFNAAFKRYFGMTPTQYKNISYNI